MTERQIEAVEEAEIENQDQTGLVPQEEPLGADAMDGMIKAGHKIQAYDQALSMILNVVMKRTYAGDWVSHARAKDPVHLRSASLSGAGCERVAVILGISEKNWKEHPKQMTDDGKHYSYRYEADFVLGGRIVHAYGEASTRNKFFSFENGQWKELTEIREDHIRKAAQRECQKDGIRRLLGLRKIPLMKLQELGFKLDLVHYVNFKDAKEATRGATEVPAAVQRTAPQEAAPAEKKKESKEIFESEFLPKVFEHKTSSKGSPFTVFTDEQGNKLFKWGPKEDATIQEILMAHRDAERVHVTHTTEEKNGVIYRNIQEVLEVIPNE